MMTEWRRSVIFLLTQSLTKEFAESEIKANAKMN